MSQKKYTEEEARLLAHRSLDEPLSTAEQVLLTEVFDDFPELREEVERLEEMSQLFTQLRAEPSADFAQRVIGVLPAPLVWYRPLIKRWSAVAAAACVALLLALSFIYINSGTLETEAILGLEEIWVEDAYAFE
ncbi:MAG: hypothetical protein AAFN81_04875 [Bacteroidota bacterium]